MTLKSLCAFFSRSFDGSDAMLFRKDQADRDACRHELMAMDDIPTALLPDDLLGESCRP